MNLRISLLLICILSWASIFGVLIYKSDIGKEDVENTSNFFYRISSQDLTNISITKDSKTLSWHSGKDHNWFFDNLDGIPANNYRWGGIIDLLSGPKLYRTLADDIDNKSKYGLDDPSLQITMYLKNGDKRILYIGDMTPDGINNYAYMEGQKALVMVDNTWYGVFSRLVEDPPYPDWMFELDPLTAIEFVLINNSKIYKAVGKNKNNEKWHECSLPITGNPCDGDKEVDSELAINRIKHISEMTILKSEKLNLMFAEDYEGYGLGPNAPYIDIKTVSLDSKGNRTIYNTSMSIGNITEDKTGYYVVAKETKDVIIVEKKWGDTTLSFFQ